MPASKTPLHRIIARKIKHHITTRSIGYLPSISRLARDYQVSLTTMWKALDLLRSAGILDYSQGRRITVPANLGLTTNQRGMHEHSSAGRLYLKIREAISHRQFPPGTALPKIDYFVLTEHVTQKTVSAAYSMLEHDGVVGRTGRTWIVLPDSGKRKRTFNRSRKSVRGDKRVVCVLVRSLIVWQKTHHCYPFRTFIETFCREMENRNVDLKWITSEKGEHSQLVSSGTDQTREFLKNLGRRYTGTLIISGHGEEHIRNMEEWFELLEAYHQPAILFDKHNLYRGNLLSGKRKEHVWPARRCCCPEEKSVEVLLRALWDRGHSRIGIPSLFLGDHTGAVFAQRIELLCTSNFTSACGMQLYVFDPFEHSAGMNGKSNIFGLTDRLLPFAHGIDDDVRTGMMKALLYFTSHVNVTALIALNDYIAFCCYSLLSSRGIGIPGQISLVSFHSHEDSRLFHLSAVDAGYESLAYRTARVFSGESTVAEGRDGDIIGSPGITSGETFGEAL